MRVAQEANSGVRYDSWAPAASRSIAPFFSVLREGLGAIRQLCILYKVPPTLLRSAITMYRRKQRTEIECIEGYCFIHSRQAGERCILSSFTPHSPYGKAANPLVAGGSKRKVRDKDGDLPAHGPEATSVGEVWKGVEIGRYD
ncbi:hypothetical protein SCUP515_03435 [Seiridium cupressi]